MKPATDEQIEIWRGVVSRWVTGNSISVIELDDLFENAIAGMSARIREQQAIIDGYKSEYAEMESIIANALGYDDVLTLAMDTPATMAQMAADKIREQQAEIESFRSAVQLMADTNMCQANANDRSVWALKSVIKDMQAEIERLNRIVDLAVKAVDRRWESDRTEALDDLEIYIDKWREGKANNGD